MKQNNNTRISLIVVLIVTFCIIFTNYTRKKRLEREALIETAKKDFSNTFYNNENAHFDSVIAIKDTVFFYNNDSFLGKTVVVVE